jgi:hypothetical protein
VRDVRRHTAASSSSAVAGEHNPEDQHGVKPWSRTALASIVGRRWPNSWSLPWLTAVLGALGVLLYLVLRVVASQFYAPLGLTVDDVGLGQHAMLVRAAVGVVFITVMCGALWLGLILGILFAVVTQLKESALTGHHGRFALAVTGALAGFAVTFGLGSWLSASGGELRGLAGAILVSCSLTWALGVMAGPMLQTYRRALSALGLSLLALLYIGVSQPRRRRERRCERGPLRACSDHGRIGRSCDAVPRADRVRRSRQVRPRNRALRHLPRPGWTQRRGL